MPFWQLVKELPDDLAKKLMISLLLDDVEGEGNDSIVTMITDDFPVEERSMILDSLLSGFKDLRDFIEFNFNKRESKGESKGEFKNTKENLCPNDKLLLAIILLLVVDERIHSILPLLLQRFIVPCLSDDHLLLSELGDLWPRVPPQAFDTLYPAFLASRSYPFTFNDFNRPFLAQFPHWWKVTSLEPLRATPEQHHQSLVEIFAKLGPPVSSFLSPVDFVWYLNASDIPLWTHVTHLRAERKTVLPLTCENIKRLFFISRSRDTAFLSKFSFTIACDAANNRQEALNLLAYYKNGFRPDSLFHRLVAKGLIAREWFLRVLEFEQDKTLRLKLRERYLRRTQSSKADTDSATDSSDSEFEGREREKFLFL